MNCLSARQLAAGPLAVAAPALRQRCLSVVVRASKPHAAKKAAAEAVRKAEMPAFLKPAALLALTNALAALPAHAEAGKIFDFNATLPIMVGQFLLLMVFLDKFWFTPVGKVLDERDALIRKSLGSVKEGGNELEALQAEAERVLAEARAEAQKLIAEARAQGTEAGNAEVAKAKAQIDKELAQALATLAAEKDAALSDLNTQVKKLADEILSRVLPAEIKI